MDKAIAGEKEAPYLVLRAMLAETLERQDARESNLAEAFTLFGPMSTLDDWELGWFLTGTKMAGDRQKVEMANNERRRRMASTKGLDEGVSGELPITAQGLLRVDR